MSLEIKPSIWDDAKHWDKDWAREWNTITIIFTKIDELERCFMQIEMNTYHRIAQQQIITGLKRYATSLLKMIEKKYGKN